MNKQALTIIILIALTALIGWQYFLPAARETSWLRDELKSWQAKLSDAQNLSRKLDELKKKYETMDTEAERMEQAITKKDDLPGLIVQLEELSSRNGLILSGVTFNAADDKDKKSKKVVALAEGVKVLAVDLNLNGSQASLIAFLKAVEANLRLMDVTLVSFGEQETGASTGQELKVSLNTYFME
ncbi:type 4a pilus biogenesis protein PilO [Patescibacteria group bacterium]|nr:type 4a pilus biogenesis protein PilO [Patescibacteria group bacterium]